MNVLVREKGMWRTAVVSLGDRSAVVSRAWLWRRQRSAGLFTPISLLVHLSPRPSPVPVSGVIINQGGDKWKKWEQIKSANHLWGSMSRLSFSVPSTDSFPTQRARRDPPRQRVARLLPLISITLTSLPFITNRCQLIEQWIEKKHEGE